MLQVMVKLVPANDVEVINGLATVLPGPAWAFPKLCPRRKKETSSSVRV